MSTMIQYVLYLAILVVLAIPLGAYIKNVMSGEKTFLSKVLTPCENLIYKVMSFLVAIQRKNHSDSCKDGKSLSGNIYRSLCGNAKYSGDE